MGFRTIVLSALGEGGLERSGRRGSGRRSRRFSGGGGGEEGPKQRREE